METSDTPTNRKTPMEELSKDDLIKKCNNLLLIAKKAKRAKDESSEELKKYKENEQKLSSDIAALKEVVESFNKKQHEFAEVQNKNKITEEKNSELQKDFKKLEEKYAEKVADCLKLEETCKKLSDTISALDESNSENVAKLNALNESYQKLNCENKINLGQLQEYQQKQIELRKKLQFTEEKYIKLEMTLNEFHGKYIEECKNYEELQEALTKLQNKNSSGRCSSRSSDSLKPVYENQEYDEILEKYNDLLEKSKVNNLEMEKLNKKLNDSENLVKEWSTKYAKLAEEYQKILENWNDLVIESEKLQKDHIDSKTLKQVLKEKESEYEKVVLELNEKNKILANQDVLVKENLILKEKIQDMEPSFSKVVEDLNQKIAQCEELVEDFNQCKSCLQSVEAKLEIESKAKITALEELDKMKALLNEKCLEIEELNKMIKMGEQLLNERQAKLLANDKELCNLTKENWMALEHLDEFKQEYYRSMSELTCTVERKEAIIREVNEKYNQICMENEKLLKKLEENKIFITELKNNYESAIVEKNELIEMFRSDKSTEEIFKKNISQLEQELTILREENDIADKRYKEMENKLEESRDTSELLKKEIDGKCDEYEAFKKEMEFYRSKNDELRKEIVTKEKECSSYQIKCEELTNMEKENIKKMENLERDLKASIDSMKTVRENFNKLEEELKREKERNERNGIAKNCYMFEEVSLKDEQWKGILQDYADVNNAVDSSRLLEDLRKTRAELERLRGNVQGNDKIAKADISSQVEKEFLANERISEAEREETTSFGSSREKEELQNKICSLWIALGEVKSLKIQINGEIRDFFQSIRNDNVRVFQDIMKSIGDVFCNLQSGHSELLKEMNDMNQALKERGEVISRLEKVNESHHQELSEAGTKIMLLDSKLTEKKNKLKQMLIDLEETKLDVENKEKTIKEMEEEIWKLKNSDSPAEALSSSTLSRVEEAARLMDVEESFEDRYSELKIFAAKLKKKVSEQRKQLEEERSRSVAKNNEYQNKIANFQSQIKSLINLQAEYDKLQDTFEEEKNDKNKLRKMLESANEKMESFKQEIDNLKKEKDAFLNDKSSFANVNKKLSTQIITLKASVEEEKAKQAKLEKEIERLEYERTLKDKKLEEEKEKHKSTIALLEKQKMETKNLGVLKLEIAEYEKSVGDLERKLAVKEENVKELNYLLEHQRSQCKLYLDEITHLKSQLTEENERATEASMQVEKFNQESSNRQVEIEEKLNEICTLRSALEEKKKEMEEVSLELAKIGQEKLKVEEKCKIIQDHCSREIHSLKDTVSNLQDSVNQRDLELTELKKEFDAYKVRAQSVLRLSQKEMNQSMQRNVVEELEQVRSTSESLKSRLEESALKMQKLVEENEVFQEEKNRLYTRIQELKNSLADLRVENEELKINKQKELENYNESLKLQKLQSETLAHCFQKKIEEMEANHKKEVEELIKDNHQLQKQFQKVILSTTDKTNERRDANERKRSSSGFIPVKADKEILDVMLLEREECEGSESIDSISPQTGNNPNLIPLDQLLNSSENPDQLDEKRSPVPDINQLSEKLEKSENRIKHLTVLLTDAETDCARLQHLNDVLKEEIRRNQRNVEREQHAQNFEYMKNVVLKFISLPNADEKIRLVPVLNTILKLSPEEENILANAARGIADNSNRGWGSYLNIWPSAQ